MFEIMKSLAEKNALTPEHVQKAVTLGWITPEQAAELLPEGDE